MEELGILKIASLLAGLTAITLMIVRFYLVYKKKVSFKTGMKLIEAIISVCIIKVLLSIVTLSIFGIIAWSVNTFIWFMLAELEKNSEKNKERRKRGEEGVYLSFKETVDKIGESFKSKKK